MYDGAVGVCQVRALSVCVCGHVYVHVGMCMCAWVCKVCVYVSMYILCRMHAFVCACV